MHIHNIWPTQGYAVHFFANSPKSQKLGMPWYAIQVSESVHVFMLGMPNQNIKPPKGTSCWCRGSEFHLHLRHHFFKHSHRMSPDDVTKKRYGAAEIGNIWKHCSIGFLDFYLLWILWIGFFILNWFLYSQGWLLTIQLRCPLNLWPFGPSLVQNHRVLSS